MDVLWNFSERCQATKPSTINPLFVLRCIWLNTSLVTNYQLPIRTRNISVLSPEKKTNTLVVYKKQEKTRKNKKKKEKKHEKNKKKQEKTVKSLKRPEEPPKNKAEQCTEITAGSQHCENRTSRKKSRYSNSWTKHQHIDKHIDSIIMYHKSINFNSHPNLWKKN